MKSNRLVRSSWLLAVILLLCPVLMGCPQTAAWRDSQIKKSHDLAEEERIIPPEERIEIPRNVRLSLPVHGSFKILEYAKGDEVGLRILSSWDTTTTIQWVTTWFAEQGYESGDNVSRILEGVTYQNQDAKYTSIRVKVDMNTAEQCTIELTATCT